MRIAIPAIGLLVIAVALSLVSGLILPLTNGPTIRFVVPDEYVGYLAIRWDCPDGIRLPMELFSRWSDAEIVLGANGSACVADEIPRSGFVNGGYYFASGSKAPAISGGTRALTGNATPPAHEFVFTYASLGLGNGQILGDECSWTEFVIDRFGATRISPAPCKPIYALRDPSVPLTPGAPAGP